MRTIRGTTISCWCYNEDKARTRWVTIQEAVPIVRPLQNHLPVETHLTTVAGLAMPQYLPSTRRSSPLCCRLDSCDCAADSCKTSSHSIFLDRQTSSRVLTSKRSTISASCSFLEALRHQSSAAAPYLFINPTTGQMHKLAVFFLSLTKGRPLRRQQLS